MRPDRAAARGYSGTTLPGGGALQAVLERSFPTPNGIGPRSSHTGPCRPPIGTIRHSLVARVDRPPPHRPWPGGHPRAPGRYRFKSCLRLQSNGTEHPNKEVSVDSTLAPVYNLRAGSSINNYR